MEEILIAEENVERRTLDWKQPEEDKEKEQWKDRDWEPLSLSELKRTYKENDMWQKPLRGMYHYQIIDSIQEILNKQNYEMEITEIFATRNASRRNPSVVINPDIEKEYEKNAIEAHVLRRVFANIRVFNYDDDELTTNVALAFHQDKIQIGYGPMVKVCHNQCILSPERVLSTSRGVTIHDIIDQFANHMMTLQTKIESDKRMIERMKNYEVIPSHILQIIGMFEANNVSYNSKSDNVIHTKEMFPLSITQIGRFTEDILVKLHNSVNNTVSLWDVYNTATNLYKGNLMETPNIFPQHLALTRYMNGILEIC